MSRTMPKRDTVGPVSHHISYHVGFVVFSALTVLGVVYGMYKFMENDPTGGFLMFWMLVMVTLGLIGIILLCGILGQCYDAVAPDKTAASPLDQEAVGLIEPKA